MWNNIADYQQTRHIFTGLVEHLMSDENGVCEHAFIRLRDIAHFLNMERTEQCLIQRADATDGRFYMDKEAMMCMRNCMIADLEDCR